MSNDIQAWAQVRETSIEIAQAIFEVANNNEAIAQKLWEEGNDRALEIAFTKTSDDVLFWGEDRVERKDV